MSQKIVLEAALDKVVELTKQRDDLLAACKMGLVAIEGVIKVSQQQGQEAPNCVETKKFIESAIAGDNL